MNLALNDSISFEEAIAFTQSFLNEIETLTENQKEETIANLVKTENGARGFFVTYLTDERSFIDNPSEGVINGLKIAPEIVGELLVKNVAMSTAMSITHQRNNDQEMRQKSQRVTQRSLKLIQELQSNIITEKIEKLQETIKNNQGEYQEFLERWGYDEEQKQLILEKLREYSNSKI
jgi:hypothetical protein